MVTRPPVPYMDYLVPGLLLSFSAAACSFFISTLVQPQNARGPGAPQVALKASAGLEKVVGQLRASPKTLKEGHFGRGFAGVLIGLRSSFKSMLNPCVRCGRLATY